jgi:hypothetical protein
LRTDFGTASHIHTLSQAARLTFILDESSKVRLENSSELCETSSTSYVRSQSTKDLYLPMLPRSIFKVIVRYSREPGRGNRSIILLGHGQCWKAMCYQSWTKERILNLSGTIL